MAHGKSWNMPWSNGGWQNDEVQHQVDLSEAPDMSRGYPNLPEEFYIAKGAAKSACMQARLAADQLCRLESSEDRMKLATLVASCHSQASGRAAFTWSDESKLRHLSDDEHALVQQMVPHLPQICDRSGNKGMYSLLHTPPIDLSGIENILQGAADLARETSQAATVAERLERVQNDMVNDTEVIVDQTRKMSDLTSRAKAALDDFPPMLADLDKAIARHTKIVEQQAEEQSNAMADLLSLQKSMEAMQAKYSTIPAAPRRRETPSAKWSFVLLLLNALLSHSILSQLIRFLCLWTTLTVGIPSVGFLSGLRAPVEVLVGKLSFLASLFLPSATVENLRDQLYKGAVVFGMVLSSVILWGVISAWYALQAKVNSVTHAGKKCITNFFVRCLGEARLQVPDDTASPAANAEQLIGAVAAVEDILGDVKNIAESLKAYEAGINGSLARGRTLLKEAHAGVDVANDRAQTAFTDLRDIQTNLGELSTRLAQPISHHGEAETVFDDRLALFAGEVENFQTNMATYTQRMDDLITRFHGASSPQPLAQKQTTETTNRESASVQRVAPPPQHKYTGSGQLRAVPAPGNSGSGRRKSHNHSAQTKFLRKVRNNGVNNIRIARGLKGNMTNSTEETRARALPKSLIPRVGGGAVHSNEASSMVGAGTASGHAVASGNAVATGCNGSASVDADIVSGQGDRGEPEPGHEARSGSQETSSLPRRYQLRSAKKNS